MLLYISFVANTLFYKLFFTYLSNCEELHSRPITKPLKYTVGLALWCGRVSHYQHSNMSTHLTSCSISNLPPGYCAWESRK